MPGWFSNRMSGRCSVEHVARAVLVARPEAGHDVDEHLREAEAGHRARGAGAELLVEHDRAEPAEDRDPRLGGAHRGDLGR